MTARLHLVALAALLAASVAGLLLWRDWGLPVALDGLARFCL